MFKCAQRARVRTRVLRRRHHQIVATELAFGTDAARYPPHGRMVEQQPFDHALRQVHQIIVAPNVRELVQQHGFDLCRGQSGQQA